MSAPPLAPQLNGDATVYIILSDFGSLGRAYVETDEAAASESDVVSNITSGQYTTSTSGGFQHR